MSETMPALPGFDEFLRRDVDRAGAVDLTDKRYTAVNVRRDYPGVYDSCARALFFYKLPVRMIADLLHLNKACVAAIRDQVIAASSTDPRAAFLTQSRRVSQRDIVLSQLTDALAERLSDDAQLSSMSVTEITELLTKLERAPAARNGSDAGKVSQTVTDAEIIDASTFDDALNGLDGGKKCARIGSGSVGGGSGGDAVNGVGDAQDPSAPECSTGSAS